MARALKKGDSITVALRAGGLERTEVHDVTPFVVYRGVVGGAPGGSVSFAAVVDDRSEHLFADEGITWVRGHVADDSVEGRALIAANALASKFDLGLAFTTSVATTSSAFRHPAFSPNPTLSIGNNPNPKNELGE